MQPGAPQSRIHPLSTIDTSTLEPDGGPDYNRLIFEASPYLLQHATNPVDWYPWGEAAFAEARRRDVPVFLSIGYATCHWCHVMERESFEDEAVAALLNRHFVAIKVDREERPDLDQWYMSACQLVNGHGGWPLNLFLDGERTPFFAATYIPKEPRAGGYGLLQLLAQIVRLWQSDRARLQQAGRDIGSALQQLNAGAAATVPDNEPLRRALEHYRQSFDPLHGGFGDAPKFPSPHQLMLLLRLASRFADPSAGAMALATLRAIARGGLHDQLGGGIHRYSVDERWLVPHFEKMLYDQALCALAACEAWQATQEPLFAELTRSLLDYLLRDLRDPQGGFYSGEDADSEGEEGRYYLWRPEEIAALLPPEDAALVCAAFGVSATGNFEGRNILWHAEPLAALAQRRGIPPEALAARLQDAKELLRRGREERVRPLLDDKVVCGWNGLAIAALARAGAVFAQARWLAAARQAAVFLLRELTDSEGGLLRRWRRGQAGVPAFLEDYAAVVWGLTELHQATLDEHWRQEARRLAYRLLQLFGDGEGGLYDTAASGEVPFRPRSWQDGALPAGASLAAYALLRLGRLGSDASLEASGREVLARQLGQAQRYPSAAALLLMALDFALGPATLVELQLEPGEESAAWLAALRSVWRPNLLVRRGAPSASGPRAHVCHGEVCLEPVNTVEALVECLKKLPLV